MRASIFVVRRDRVRARVARYSIEVPAVDVALVAPVADAAWGPNAAVEVAIVAAAAPAALAADCSSDIAAVASRRQAASAANSLDHVSWRCVRPDLGPHLQAPAVAAQRAVALHDPAPVDRLEPDMFHVRSMGADLAVQHW